MTKKKLRKYRTEDRKIFCKVFKKLLKLTGIKLEDIIEVSTNVNLGEKFPCYIHIETWNIETNIFGGCTVDKHSNVYVQ